MNEIFWFSLLYIFGVIIAAFAQILLKKAAAVKHDNILKEYLNWKTIVAYAVFFGATLCSVFSYKYIPLSMGPILGASEYLFVAILSRIFIKEKINSKKIVGLVIIIIGIIIFSMQC